MIFYLSGTGNTRWAAKTIAEKTGDRLVSIPDLVRMVNSHPKTSGISVTLAEGERLGLCFPVHGWRPPLIVRDFISRLCVNANGHYVYALCTAGDNIGETMDLLCSDLLKRGIGLSAAFSLIMPESYLGLPFFNLDSPEREKAKIEKSAADLQKFADDILRLRYCEHLVKGRWPRIDSRLLGGFFKRYLITDRHFHVDSRRCVKCGICADVCPTHNVDGGLGHEPRWRHDGSCLACFACYHHCPHHAIDYGCLTKHKGQYFFEKAAR